MASTTALFTGLSGLAANSRRLDVIGNNIANVNTIAFKSNRMIFAPTFSRNFSLGTAPSESIGGTNPGQIGLGVSIAGTQRNFNNGAITATDGAAYMQCRVTFISNGETQLTAELSALGFAFHE